LRHARAADINRGSVARSDARSFCSKAGTRDARALDEKSAVLVGLSDATELKPLLVVPLNVVENVVAAELDDAL
jgi:hypothetical protein